MSALVPKLKFQLTSPWPSGLGRQTILDRLAKNWGGVQEKKIFFQKKKNSFDLKIDFYAVFQVMCNFLTDLCGHFH